MEYNGLKLRYEKKYYISMYEQEIISQRLKNAMKADLNVEENNTYTVTSLYLDDMYNSSYQEKLAGIMHRNKYRIRMYKNNPSKLRLENKIKHGEFIGKESCILTDEQYKAIISGENAHILLDAKQNIFHQIFTDIRINRLSPRVIVEYDREVYLADQGNVRITFDHRLRAGVRSLDLKKLDSNMISVDNGDRVIMEVKYESFLPSYINELLKVPSRENLSISKYVICVDIENLFGGCFYEGQHTIVPRYI